MVSLRPNRLFRRHSGIHGLALIHAGARVVTTISDHFECPICETPHGRLSSSGGRPVYAQFVAHVRRTPGQCAKPSPGKVSRTLHAAYSRTEPRDALAVCRLPSASDGSPPECAVIAQIAHSKYAAQYARLVRIPACVTAAGSH